MCQDPNSEYESSNSVPGTSCAHEGSKAFMWAKRASIASCVLGVACLTCLVLGYSALSDALLFTSIGCGSVALLLALLGLYFSDTASAYKGFLLCVLSAFVWLMLPAVRSPLEARIRAQTADRFKRIAIAFF